MTQYSHDVTQLLRLWSDGDAGALDRLVPLVYDHLHRIAHQHLRNEAESPSLDTTGIVHEAYIKLVDLRRARFRDRAHFLAMASRLMRRLLVDHARARRAAKRGGGAEAVELADESWMSEAQAGVITELHEALERLESIDPRQSQILEQRYFGGLSLDETAEASGLSTATIKRELRFARAWLAAELGAEGAGEGVD